MDRRIKKNIALSATVFLAVFLLSGCSGNYSSNNVGGVGAHGQQYNSAGSTTSVPISNSCGDGYYKNADGVCIHSPSKTNCVGATAICSDGACSFSQHRQGTCSGHGGVAQWL